MLINHAQKSPHIIQSIMAKLKTHQCWAITVLNKMLFSKNALTPVYPICTQVYLVSNLFDTQET